MLYLALPKARISVKMNCKKNNPTLNQTLLPKALASLTAIRAELKMPATQLITIPMR